MNRSISSVLFISLLCIVYSKSKHERQCIDYYSTGNNFDLNDIAGQWYSLYFWPPNQRKRDYCQVVDFKKLTDTEIGSLKKDCDDESLNGDQVFMGAAYTNAAGKLVNVTYYGNSEVKHVYRECDRIFTYILLKVDKDYLLSINCSASGRGVLLSRKIDKLSQVQAVVDRIEIMTGRDGSPDCDLA